MKFLILLLVLYSSIFAKTYAFKDIRYSYALDSSSMREGLISFDDGMLHIKYDSSDKELLYESSVLTISKAGKVLKLDSRQEEIIASFLETLLLIYNDDKIIMHEEFDISRNNSTITLVPKYYIKNYIKEIFLSKSNKIVKEIKLVLHNNDSITISIGNEIR